MEVVQWTRRNKIKNMQICIGPVHLFNYCSHLWPHFHNILFESDHFQKLSNHVWFNFAPSEALIWQLSPLPWSHSPVSSPRLGQENWFPITTTFSTLCWSTPQTLDCVTLHLGLHPNSTFSKLKDDKWSNYIKTGPTVHEDIYEQHILHYRGSINNSLHSSDYCPPHFYPGDHCNALVNFFNAKIVNINSVHWLLHLQQFFSSRSSNYIRTATLKFPPSLSCCHNWTHKKIIHLSTQPLPTPLIKAHHLSNLLQ